MSFDFRSIKGLFAFIFAAAVCFGGTLGVFGQTFNPPYPLPSSPPSPDMIMRDSFGQGPEMMRPASGKGTLKDTALGVSMGGFWLEYPGTKNNRWIAPDSGDTWRYCGTGPNPFELYSPLQTVFGFEQNGFLCTLLNAPQTSTIRPTALMPLPTNLTTPWEVGIEGFYWNLPGSYVALGMTNSGATTNNLSNGGSAVLVIRPNPADNGSSILYEFRTGGFNGALLGSGIAEEGFFNQMRIRYNPQTRSVGASFQGIEIGTFATNISAPRYVGFEGVGYADNFVVRRLQ